MTLPDNQTATTNLYGSGYGPGGFSTFSGTANTTSYGSKTTYLPYNINRYDYFASYWVKTKPSILGVHIQNLTPELRQKVGSNKGVFVIAVMKNTPAFSADIFRGDVLKRIGDIEITDVQNCIEAIRFHEGKKTTVLILRDGKEIEKEILFSKKM